MGITINGSSAAGNIDLGTNGTIADLAVGGVPNGTIDRDTLAADVIDGTKLADDAVAQEHIADASIDEARLQISNSPTNGYFLSAQSGNTGGLTWAEAGGGVDSDAQQNTLAGTNAGDSFDGTNAIQNTLFGYDCGTSITTGDYNTAFGKSALDGLETGSQNTAVGANCQGGGSMTGSYNVGMGSNVLTSLTSSSYNVAIGNETLEGLTTGNYNTAVGFKAGENIDTGTNNVCVGPYAGDAITSGTGNVAIGYNSFSASSGNGNYNVCVGENAGTALDADSENVLVGYEAGKALTKYGNTCVGHQAGKTWSHSDNDYELVAIGRQAGMNQSGGMGQLYIARRDHSPGSGSVWVYGSNGGACTQGNNSSSWTTTSDQRLKKNIVDNNIGLVAIEQLQVKNFEYRTEDEIDRSEFPKVTQGKWTQADEDAGLGTKDEWKQRMSLGHSGTQIGLIAQELEAVLPECVTTDVRGVKTVDTDEIMWHMLTAIKELSTKVKALEAG